ncbi:MAG: HAMP domain-containing histidine kinase [Lachnospiraceae bacterium]|nr:HAMP domain-containing histidine kinase [Lachnospiraceae bacterium]
MRYGQYIREHKLWVIIFACLLGSFEIFLLTIKGSGWLMVYVAAACVVGFLLGTFVDYKRWAKYFQHIDNLMEDLDKKYLLCELLEQGDTQEEKKLKEILYDMEVSMNERVSRYRRGSKEYKEYIESWVHEIKLPIATMKMILANHKEQDPGLEEELGRLEGYVEQSLFYARSNDVEKDYLINEVSLERTVQEVILKRKKTLRNIKTGINLHDLEQTIYSDSKWLEFILGQIVDNSIKYGEEGKLRLEIYSEKKDNAVLLYIKDNGCGIKSSETYRVFDKGFTGSNGRAGKNSTGIGLYLCKKLCDRLEHNIGIESEEGQGTTVTIVFPLSDMVQMTE